MPAEGQAQRSGNGLFVHVHDKYGVFSQINSQYNFQQQIVRLSKNVYDAVLTIQKETRHFRDWLWNSFEIFQKKFS